MYRNYILNVNESQYAHSNAFNRIQNFKFLSIHFEIGS